MLMLFVCLLVCRRDDDRAGIRDRREEGTGEGS